MLDGSPRRLRSGIEVTMKILVLNGPNLNFLGIREKEIYGTQDYEYLLSLIAKKGQEENCEIEVFQSNHEGALIDRIQDAYADGTEGIKHLKAAKKIHVITQEKNSCTVYGMPKAAAEAGLSDQVVPLEQVAQEIIMNVGVM